MINKKRIIQLNAHGVRTGPASKKINVACFVTPYGFGHAARAAAVMEAMHHRMPDLNFEIYSSVPFWFFAESLSGFFTYHHLVTDIGLVQQTPLQEDLEATLEKLDAMLPFERAQIHHLAEQVRCDHCRLILCDIAPLGIAVAHAAGVPSVLIENFTWDWIYEAYNTHHGRMSPHVDYLRQIFSTAEHHIQTAPACRHGPADRVTSPVARKPRTAAGQIRRRLAIPPEAPLVLVTLGGIPPAFELFEQFPMPREYYAVIPGGAETYQLKGNVRLLAHHSGFYHPDLMAACDAVIGKLGYSTLAEVFHGGIPFGYIPRQGFRESAVLEAFVDEQMHGIALHPEQLADGSWAERIPQLLAMPRIVRKIQNGAEQAAEYICRLLDG